MDRQTGRASLVGRERELTILLDRLRLAAQGAGGVALVSGEPGIGKTRLLETLAERARDDGWMVLAGRAYELQGMPPYLPFVEALRGYVRTSSAEELAVQLGDAAAIVALMLPQVRERLGEVSTEISSLPGDDRYRLFAGVADFLQAIAGSAEANGLLVLLDDLHWADQSSLLLLRYLASALRDGRILLAGACRTVELGAVHPLHDLLADLERDGPAARLTLGPLMPGATEALVAQLGGRAAAPVMERIHRITDGNPFFVTQVVCHLVGTGRNLGDPLVAEVVWETPEGVREVIGRRVERLRPEWRSAMEMGAVLGERFDYTVLAQALGAEAATTADGIEVAVEAGLIREEGDGYQFMHALIRQTLYEGISLPRRQRLHLVAAEAVERLEVPDRVGHAATLAGHYRLAGTLAPREKRLHWERQAAGTAARAFAWEESIAHLEAALDALGDDDDLHYAILMDLGEMHIRRGTFREALSWFESAAGYARALDSPELLARAAIGVPQVMGMDRDLVMRIRALLEEALVALDGAETGLRARVMGALGYALCQPFYGEFERGEQLANGAIELARRAGTRADLAATLRDSGSVRWQRGRAHARHQAASELLTVAREVGDAELILLGHRIRLTALVELGDLAAADEEDAAYQRIADRLQQPLYRLLRLIRLGLRAILAGNFDEAWALIAETRALGLKLGTRDQWTPWQEITLRREFGQFEEMESLVRQELIEDDRSLNWRCILAWVLTERGQMAAAREEFERLVDVELSHLPISTAWYISIAALAQVCASLHDPDRAATIYALLEPYGYVNLSMNGQVTSFGSAERFLGMLAATMGRWEDASRHFKAAIEHNSRMNARPWVAHTLQDHAAMLIARGERGAMGEARGMLEQAASLYDELGMEVWAERARALLPEAGHSLARAPGGLTAREIEVLQMIAAGRSNREIAGELVLSIRTVEKHIETIYSKIGAHGQSARAAAATYAVRRGLVSSDAPAPR